VEIRPAIHGLVYSASLFAIKTGTAFAGLLLHGCSRNTVTSQCRTDCHSSLHHAHVHAVPAGFAVLKAIALWIYPLSQTNVNEIERNWRPAAHRKSGN